MNDLATKENDMPSDKFKLKAVKLKHEGTELLNYSHCNTTNICN
jgi:hypothetical protein